MLRADRPRTSGLGPEATGARSGGVAGRDYSQGEANALFEVLDVRGSDVSDEIRARVTGCTDIQQLRVWIRRAATADSIDDVFA